MSALSGQVLAAISTEMVRLHAQLYGRGPAEAKTYLNDNVLICVLKGGLTRVEETLLAAGDEELVRQVRLRFQEPTRDLFRAPVERLTGRRAIGQNSQILFDPDYVIEIFLLEDPSPSPEGA